MKKSALILVLLALVISCQGPRGQESVQPSLPPPPSPTFYYATTTTNLRSCPSYGQECQDIVQVFTGDRVELLQRKDPGWAQVKTGRTGVAGWMPSNLLSIKPVPAVFSISAAKAYLRECADYKCRGIELLRRGDQVEKIDQGEGGWWRVMALKSRKTGWIPGPEVVQLGPSYKYVKVSGLALRTGPDTSFEIIETLGFNDQVKVLMMGPRGWAQVQDVKRKNMGWCAARYLVSAPISSPRQSYRKPGKRQIPPKKKILEPDEAPKVEPEAPPPQETREVKPKALPPKRTPEVEPKAM